MEYRIERTLDYYEKNSDDLAGQLPLEGVELAFLQELFGMTRDDPMFEVFPVNSLQVEALRPYVSGEIDLDRYDYYLDCSGIPTSEGVSDTRVVTETQTASPKR